MSQVNVTLSTVIDGAEKTILPVTAADQVSFDGSTVDAELRALRTLATGKGQVYVSATLTERDALTPQVGDLCWCVDASADATVTSGAALYLYKDSTAKWLKVAETESMDVVFAWASISGKPSSAVADIDAAATLVKALTPTSTELNHVKGVTSAIQTQLNAKAGKSVATGSADGLMSKTDKTKLDGIASGANNYTHPASGVTAGNYESVTVNAQGHVIAGTTQTAAQRLLATGITVTATQVNAAPGEAAKLDAVVLGPTDAVPSALRPGGLIIRKES